MMGKIGKRGKRLQSRLGSLTVCTLAVTLELSPLCKASPSRSWAVGDGEAKEHPWLEQHRCQEPPAPGYVPNVTRVLF